MTFDASRIIYVLTANDPDAVPAPLLSRVEVFDIPAPEPEQRLQLILAEVRRLQRATGKRIELDASAAEALSERSDVDLRATHRLVQDAFATAMASERPSPCSRCRGALRGWRSASQRTAKRASEPRAWRH